MVHLYYLWLHQNFSTVPFCLLLSLDFSQTIPTNSLLEGHESPVLNLTSKPLGLALTPVSQKDEQSMAMGWVNIDHTACGKWHFWLCTKTCQIFKQCMVFSLCDFEIPRTKAEQVARFPDLSSPWGGRYSVRQRWDRVASKCFFLTQKYVLWMCIYRKLSYTLSFSSVKVCSKLGASTVLFAMPIAHLGALNATMLWTVVQIDPSQKQ